jgi:hypothetical protein
MGKNEKSHKKMASLASKVLSGKKKPTKAEILSLAADVLTQTADRKKKS